MHDLLVDRDLSLAYRKITSIPVQLAWDPLGNTFNTLNLNIKH